MPHDVQNVLASFGELAAFVGAGTDPHDQVGSGLHGAIVAGINHVHVRPSMSTTTTAAMLLTRTTTSTTAPYSGRGSNCSLTRTYSSIPSY